MDDRNITFKKVLNRYGITDEKIRNMNGYYKKRLQEKIGEEVLLAVGEDGVKKVQEIAKDSKMPIDQAILLYLSEDQDKIEILKVAIEKARENLQEEYFTEILESVPEVEFPQAAQELKNLLASNT